VKNRIGWLKQLIWAGVGHRKAEAYHIYDLIWSIPREYGGMTSAMLHRCWQFHHFGVGKSLTILTLQIDLNVSWAQKHIEERWGIPRKVRVRNIWADLRSASDSELLRLSGDKPESFTSFDTAKCNLSCTRTWSHTREYTDSAGRVLYREHFRADSSPLCVVGVEGDRRITFLFDSTGKPIKQYRSTQELYLAWLDWVIEQRPAVLINEHRNISQFIYRLDIPGVKLCQVIHSAHQRDAHSPYGELNSRANMVCNIEHFDLVSVLTEWQRQDLLALGAESKNLRVMPNATKQVDISERDLATPRCAGKGIVIGRLTPGKQVSHSLRALASLRAEPAAQLDIYGDGEERENLEALSAELGLTGKAVFKGHVPNAQEALINHSFLLFTSRQEGQGLVLLESMARGCVPISYDIRYGPRDVITHGVDGFLVPMGDVDALVATVQHFLEMPEQARLAMRRAAIKRATDFSPENNMRRWRSALDEVMGQPKRERVRYEGSLRAIADEVLVQDGRCSLRGRLYGELADIARPAKVVVCTRNKSTFLKLETDNQIISDTEKAFTASFELDHIPLRKGDFLDFHLQPLGVFWGDKVRIHSALEFESKQYPDCRVYRTKYGNLSLDCRE